MKLLALLLSLVGLTSTVHALDLGPIPNGLGVNIHFTQEVPGELDMIRAAGFGLVRMDLFWHSIEKTRGEYDFSEYDKLVDGVEKHGMKIILIVDYSNRLYDNDLSVHTDEGRAAYASFAAAAATHYKGRSVIFEIYNEPNIHFWRPVPNADDYAKMALLACQKMRAADPNCTIIGPALAGVEELDFLETCFQAGLLKYWNAVSVHPYRQTAPETVESDYRNIRALIRKYTDAKQEIPIVSGEWGFSDAWASFDRDKQAKYLARQFLTNLANDIPLSIYYDWRDDGTDPKEPEHHFGLVEHDPTGDPNQPFKPKPAYLAAKTVMEQLKGLKFNKRLHLDDANDCVLLFGSRALVAWRSNDYLNTVRLPLGVGKVTRVESRGAATTLDVASVGPDVDLTPSPIYLTPAARDLVLETIAEWAEPPSPLAVFPARTARISNKTSLSIVNGEEKIPAGMPGASAVKFQGNIFDPILSTSTEISLDAMVLRQEKQEASPNVVGLQCVPVAPDHLMIRCESELTGSRAVHGNITFSKPAAAVVPVSVQDKSLYQLVELPSAADADYEASLKISVSFGGSNGFPNGVPAEFARNLRFRTLPDSIELESVVEGDEQSIATASFSKKMINEKLFEDQREVWGGKYEFSNGWKYICIKPGKEPLPIDGQPTKLGLWVYGDKSKNLLRMRFIDSTGQVFQPDGGRLNFAGWKYIEFKMDGSSGGFWNGAKDGKIHYPIKIETLLLIDNASRSANQGKIYFAAPCLYYDAK